MYTEDPSGIYKITCNSTGKFYIGSAVGIKSRWSLHKFQLTKQTHHNIYLQRAWNKYGECDFLFEVIELCGVNTLLLREQYYIDTLNPEFNICRIAGSSFGLRWSLKEPHTKNHRDKIADTLSISWIVTPPNGEPFVIKNLKRFCEENGLTKQNMVAVANGRAKTAKGWTCFHLEGEAI